MSQTQSLKHFLSLLVYYVGGKENIINYTNCMTRLRVKVKDVSLIKMDEIDTVNSPRHLILKDNQLQIVLGPSLAKLATEILDKELAE